MTHEFIVEELKTRLDKYLAKQLPEISRSSIQRDIEGGQAEVNGQPIIESKFVVRLNDKVVYRVTSDESRVTSLKPTNTPLKVLYNNHGLLIIDKPAGMVVHQGAGFKGETLASALLYHFSAKGGSQPKADQPPAGAKNSGGNSFYFVDLPGYGFAKGSKDDQEKIQSLIYWYLLDSDYRQKIVVLIIDASIGATENDMQMLYSLKEQNKNIVIVANKVDKIKKSEVKNQLNKIQEVVGNYPIIPFSSQDKIGISELLNEIFK